MNFHNTELCFCKSLSKSVGLRRSKLRHLYTLTLTGHYFWIWFPPGCIPLPWACPTGLHGLEMRWQAHPSLPLTVLPCSGLKQTSHNWLSMYLTLQEQFHIQIPGFDSHDTNLSLKINRISSRNFPHLRNCTSHFKKKWSGSLPRLQRDPSLHC